MKARTALMMSSAVGSALAAPGLGLVGHDSGHIHHESRATSKTAIASLFGWNWDSVANECAFLGSAGYGYVQVSTAMEHIQGSQWWTDYQAVSYTIQSKRGNRSQFQNMVNKCHSAGVKVIVDVIFNHMAGIDGGVGVAGSSFNHYNYGSLYSDAKGDFHHCTYTSDQQIHDWGNEAQVETCMLSNLADLNTESTTVRAKLIAHGNDLLSLGVDGFRIDAAKHIAPASISAILKGLSKSVYITQEVVDTSSNGQFSSIHQSGGQVQEFRYTYTLLSAFKSGGTGIAGLANLKNSGNNQLMWLPTGNANVFVANHDTERGYSSLSYKNYASQYTLAHVFMLTYPYGTPTVHSGFAFSSSDDGAPNNGGASCSSSTGATGSWECQHRWTPIVHLVPFYNAVTGAALTNTKTGTSNQLAYGRGSIGFTIINNDSKSWTATWTTSLPNGTYCDIVKGAKSGSKCTAGSVTVNNGKLTTAVAAGSAAVYYTGAKL